MEPADTIESVRILCFMSIVKNVACRGSWLSKKKQECKDNVGTIKCNVSISSEDAIAVFVCTDLYCPSVLPSVPGWYWFSPGTSFQTPKTCPANDW